MPDCMLVLAVHTPRHAILHSQADFVLGRFALVQKYVTVDLQVEMVPSR